MLEESWDNRMKIEKFLVGWALLLGSVRAQFTTEDEAWCLSNHNLYRETVAGSPDHWGNEMAIPCDMKELKWSEDLTALAQKTIDYHMDKDDINHYHDEEKFSEVAAAFGHSTWDFEVGQNMWWHRNSRRIPCHKKCQLAVASWYSEVRYYDTNTYKIAGPYRNSHKSFEVITHFQQLMWANTSYVGCASGFQLWRDVSKPMCIIVCNYWPPVQYGSWVRKPKPYKDGLNACCDPGYTNLNASTTLLCTEDE